MIFIVGPLTHRRGKGAPASPGFGPLTRLVPTPSLRPLLSLLLWGSPECLSTPGRARGKLKVCSGNVQCVYQLRLFPGKTSRDSKRVCKCFFGSAWKSPSPRNGGLLFRPQLRRNLNLGSIQGALSPQHPSAHICPLDTARKRGMRLAWIVWPRSDPWRGGDPRREKHKEGGGERDRVGLPHSRPQREQM